MHPGYLVALVFIVAILTVGTVLKSLIDARFRTSARPGGELDPLRGLELLSAENAGLRNQVNRLEERIAVLERIATDPAERTAREIEQLRWDARKGEEQS
jgi:hypothetical protein